MHMILTRYTYIQFSLSGPLVGGYIAQSGTPWPWLFWVLTIFVGRLTRDEYIHRPFIGYSMLCIDLLHSARDICVSWHIYLYNEYHANFVHSVPLSFCIKRSNFVWKRATTDTVLLSSSSKKNNYTSDLKTALLGPLEFSFVNQCSSQSPLTWV